MITFFYTICHAFCALPMGKQALIALVCVLITAGLIYLALWGVCALLYKLAAAVGVDPYDEREVYNADWMDLDKWEVGR